MVSTVVRAYACVGANCAATSRTVIGWRSTINWSSSHSAGLKYRGFRIGPPHWRKMSSLPFDGICRQTFQEIRPTGEKDVSAHKRWARLAMVRPTDRERERAKERKRESDMEGAWLPLRLALLAPG